MTSPQAANVMDIVGKLDRHSAAAWISVINWMRRARPKQLKPIVQKDWTDILVRSGRGWGKTEMALGIAAYRLMFPPADEPSYRVGLIVKRYQDAANLLDRAGGLLSLLPKGGYTQNKTEKRITLWNGSELKYYSAREPDSIRGDEFNLVIMDEASSFRYPHILELVDFIRRRGRSQLLVTTTLKRNEITRELVRRVPAEWQIQGSTAENIALPKHVVGYLYKYYEGTALGRQELLGEYVADVPGAVFAQSQIDQHRISEAEGEALDKSQHVFTVGIDPQGAHRPAKADADDTATLTGENLTGIVCASLAPNGHIYIWRDSSMSGQPHQWAQAAAACAKTCGGGLVNTTLVPETNYGGDMVMSVLTRAAGEYNISPVRATDSKTARAEPVSVLYAQGRIHHVGIFPEMEDEMSGFVPETRESPNRMDALVWAVSALMRPPPAIA